jgi:hypothetical protein
MKRIMLITLMLLIAACTGDPTVTPTPSPTPTPDPTVIYFEPVNPNSDLSAPFHMQHVSASIEGNDPRDVVVPAGYVYAGQTAKGTAPHILNVGETGDFIFEVDNIGRPLDGDGYAVEYRSGFGYDIATESMYWLPAGRYVYLLKLDWIDLAPLPTAQAASLPEYVASGVWYDWNISAYAYFQTSDGRSASTYSVPFPRYGQNVELLLGVIQNDVGTLLLDSFRVDIIHRTIGGSFVLTDIELQRVPDDYGDDVVIPLTRHSNAVLTIETESEESMEIIEFLEALFALPGVSAVAYTGSLIILLVELWKRFVAGYLPEKLRPSPQVLAVVLVAFFFAAHGLAVELEYDSALREVVEFVTKLVDLVGPYIFGGTIANVAVALGYNKARAMGTPGFGHKRHLL